MGSSKSLFGTCIELARQSIHIYGGTMQLSIYFQRKLCLSCGGAIEPSRMPIHSWTYIIKDRPFLVLQCMFKYARIHHPRRQISPFSSGLKAGQKAINCLEEFVKIDRVRYFNLQYWNDWLSNFKSPLLLQWARVFREQSRGNKTSSSWFTKNDILDDVSSAEMFAKVRTTRDDVIGFQSYVPFSKGQTDFFLEDKMSRW